MGKILVVDDQFGVRRLLFETFREDQHEVEMAANGAEALQLLIDFKPDLILMDMKMPGMNGLETLGQIRALDRQVGVIMMTAYGDTQNMEQAKDLGILYYMGKPFDLFELRERVREILMGT
ncbi:MAG: two-component system response regulator [Desulfosporosinus sp. BRH_c37]|nr:MAG: two-component system response regulator [Desulfosporosinus sp. BRH_c37]